MKNNHNSSSTNELVKLQPEQLITKLLNEQSRSSELWNDIQDIVKLVTQFIATNPLPGKFSIIWIIARPISVFNLIKGIVTILRTKGHVS